MVIYDQIMTITKVIILLLILLLTLQKVKLLRQVLADTEEDGRGS